MGKRSREAQAQAPAEVAEAAQAEEDAPPPPPRRVRAAAPLVPQHLLQVYAEGFPYETSDEELRAFFAPHGEVVLLKAPRWQDSGRLRGYAHATFATRAQAEAALALDKQRVGGRFITVSAARAEGAGRGGAGGGAAPTPRPTGCSTLFVRNLPYTADEAAVLAAFGRFGDVASVRVVRRSDTHVSKGFAYVQFATGAAAEAAIAAGVSVGGRATFCDWETGGAKASFKDAEGRRPGTGAAAAPPPTRGRSGGVK